MSRKINLVLFITELCNLNCEYCDIQELDAPNSIDINVFKKFSKIINDNSNVIDIALTGGEIGLLNKETLDEIFKSLDNKKIRVFTNGLFLERGYHLIYDKYISLINYHIFDLNNHTRYDYDKIKYIFIDEKTETGTTIDGVYHKKLHMKTPTIENIVITERMKQINDLFKSGSKCFLCLFMVDFVNRRIYNCCKSNRFSPFVELNEENLLEYLNKKYFVEPFYSCKYCDKLEDNYVNFIKQNARYRTIKL